MNRYCFFFVCLFLHERKVRKKIHYLQFGNIDISDMRYGDMTESNPVTVVFINRLRDGTQIII